MEKIHSIKNPGDDKYNEDLGNSRHCVNSNVHEYEVLSPTKTLYVEGNQWMDDPKDDRDYENPDNHQE